LNSNKHRFYLRLIHTDNFRIGIQTNTDTLKATDSILFGSHNARTKQEGFSNHDRYFIQGRMGSLLLTLNRRHRYSLQMKHRYSVCV